MSRLSLQYERWWKSYWDTAPEFSFHRRTWRLPRKYKRKELTPWDMATPPANGPVWWKTTYHTRPERRKLKRVMQRINLDLELWDDTSIKYVGRKPHAYWW